MRENFSLLKKICGFKECKKRSTKNYDRLKKFMESIQHCNVKQEQKSKILLEKEAK